MSSFDETEHPRTGSGRFAAKPAAAESGVDLGGSDYLGGSQHFDRVADSARREQEHATWSMKHARLRVAKAAAEEAGVRYPFAHSLVLAARVDEPGTPRRLHAVRDADGADLWTYSASRTGEPMARVSDGVLQHDIADDIDHVERFNDEHRMRESVVTIRDVHAAYEDHSRKEPTR